MNKPSSKNQYGSIDGAVLSQAKEGYRWDLTKMLRRSHLRSLREQYLLAFLAANAFETLSSLVLKLMLESTPVLLSRPSGQDEMRMHTSVRGLVVGVAGRLGWSIGAHVIAHVDSTSIYI